MRAMRGRRLTILLGIAIAGNLFGGVGALYLVSAGTDEITVDEALDRFRAARASAAPTAKATPTANASSIATRVPGSTATASAATRPRAPRTTATTASSGVLTRDLQEGVYVFDTEGYEQTDALSGAHRDYGSRTTMSINKGGCGYVWRWQPANERWDESEGCRTSAGIRLARFTMYHEFFRRGTQEDLLCDRDAIVMPDAPKDGQRWSAGCQSDDTTVELDVRVIGFETLRIGGKSVRSVRIRYEGAMSGENEGTQVQERWLALADGLLLRITSDVTARVAVPFGGKANYEEHYSLQLISIEPSR